MKDLIAGLIAMAGVVLGVLVILASIFGILGLIWWGIGSFIIWAFHLTFVWTFWKGLAVAIIATVLTSSLTVKVKKEN